MNFKFYKDGTYKKCNTKNYDGDFYLIDISTDRKGPIYTLVKDINENWDRGDISVSLDISYASTDTPCDRNTIITSTFDISSLEIFYSIYPLVKQIFAFNVFCERWSVDSCITIADIHIKTDNTDISVDESCTEKEIMKSFRYVGMTSATSKMLGDGKVLIMKKGEWEIVDGYDEEYQTYPKFYKFDYIGIPLPATESIYLLSYKEYMLFRKRCSVQINMLYAGDEDSVIATDDYCANWISLDNIRDILYGCLFTPQLVLLEQKLYDVPMYLDIVVSTPDRDMKLSVSEKEMSIPRNTCIFNIIKRLLELEPYFKIN